MGALTVHGQLPVRHKHEPCCAALAEPSLSQTQTAAVAACLKVLGDPTRLRLLDVLVQQGQPICVCDMTPHFPQHQPTISHHLRLLREAGLIETEKSGIWSYFWATERGKRAFSLVSTLP